MVKASAVASAPVASSDSLKTLAEIQTMLQSHPFYGYKDPKTLSSDRINTPLSNAFKRYADIVKNQPNQAFDYIRTHVLNKDEHEPTAGLTKNEWVIFVMGLALRVIPTTSELERRDGSLREGGFHTDAYTSNIGDEAGSKGRKSHVQLFFDSVRQLNKAMDLGLPEDMETYEMAYQLIRLRKEGITFAPPNEERMATLRNLYATRSELSARDILSIRNGEARAEFERFEEAVHSHPHQDTAAPMPHQVRKLSYAGKWEPPAVQPRGRLSATMPNAKLPHLMIDISGLPIIHWQSHKENVALHTKYRDTGPYFYDEYQFAAAQKIAALVPDAIIDYREATSGQHAPAPILTAQLDTLTREGSAAKLSHIDAYGRLVKRHLGHIQNRAAPKTAMLWSDIHVAEGDGVEPEHANQARALFLALMKAKNTTPEMLTDAFNHVVDKGYLYNQAHHWDVTVEAMEKAREEALTAGEKPIPLKPFAQKKWSQLVSNLNAITTPMKSRVARE